MNQRELFRKVAERTGTSATDIEVLMEAVTATIQDVLLEGDKVSITKLGTFKLKKRKERKGYDPYHSTVIDIPPKKSVTFEANKYFKNILVQHNNE